MNLATFLFLLLMSPISDNADGFSSVNCSYSRPSTATGSARVAGINAEILDTGAMRISAVVVQSSSASISCRRSAAKLDLAAPKIKFCPSAVGVAPCDG